MEKKGTRIAIATLKKKNKVGRISLSDLKIHYISTVIQIVCHWWNDRHINQWKGRENPEIDPHKWYKLIFDK